MYMYMSNNSTDLTFVMLVPTQQDVQGRLADALLWARMKVFRTSLFVADVERTLH